MTGIWSRLFGMSGAEIYHNFRGGTGDDARGLIEAGGRLGIVRYRYAERTKSITDLTTKMENAWQGGAAGAAQRGSGPLAVEHGLAEGGLTTANKTLYNQAQAFVTAKQSVTEIPPTPEKPGVWDNVTSLGGAGRNYENKVTQVNTANDHNVAVMEAYETTSSSNASAMPTTYGRITDDYSAVGVEKPPPPPQPTQTYPPTYPTSTTTGNNRPGTSSTSSTSSTTGNTPTNPSGQKPPGSTTTHNPSETTPSGNRPPVGVPPRGNLPGGSQNPGNQNQPLPGMLPPGYGPNNPGGGGLRGGGGGFGPRGSGGGFGPGGSGSGAGGPGAGGRGGGFGPGAGGAAAAESAAARGGLGGPGAAGRGGVGGMGGMGGGGRGQNNEDDTEHERPSFLVEPDPHDTFGTDEVTAPPVIGE